MDLSFKLPTPSPLHLVKAPLVAVQGVDTAPQPNLDHSLAVKTPVLHGAPERCPMRYRGSQHRVSCVGVSVNMNQADRSVFVLLL